MARRTTKPRASEPATPITGVASGGLGTAANLEDTQLFGLQDLREPELHEPALPESELPEPKPVLAVPVRRPVTTPAVRVPGGRRRSGAIAAALVGVLALAALLAARDGMPGGASTGDGDAAGAFPSLPPISTGAPNATAEPGTGGNDGGGGNGRGGGNGNGRGNGNGGGNGH